MEGMVALLLHNSQSSLERILTRNLTTFQQTSWPLPSGSKRSEREADCSSSVTALFGNDTTQIVQIRIFLFKGRNFT
jgi:hypothetical protein